MLYVTCGLPSAQSTFVWRLAHDVLRQAYGEVGFLRQNEGQKVNAVLDGSVTGTHLLVVDNPEIDIARRVLETGTPVIYTPVPYHMSVLHCMTALKMDLRAALRIVGMASVTLSTFSASRNVARIVLPRDGVDLSTVIQAVAAAFRLPAAEVDGDAIAAPYRTAQRPREAEGFVTPEGRIDAAQMSVLPRDTLSAADLPLLERMARNYQPLIEGRSVDRMTWPGLLCQSGDKPNGPCQGFVPMTGPARILSFGPYLNLPCGRWRVDVAFEVRGNYSGNFIYVDAVAGGILCAAGRADMPVEGRYAVSLSFDVLKPELIWEIRTTMLAGAIEGEFRLLDIALQREALEDA